MRQKADTYEIALIMQQVCLGVYMLKGALSHVGNGHISKILL